ncbi:MAG: M15 family metallopeptidase [Proteobacteria bacterium]|nr:M15 family metallopeptidase [Pseudomonadota bacterium]
MRCEDIASHPDFRPLSAIAGIAIDLRYAGPHNFVGRDLYGDLDCGWLHREAASALQLAATRLAADLPGHRLLVLDALRPHRVQRLLWAHLAGTGLREYVADPAIGSIHSYGMAVDATIVGPDGCELDMGSGFDEMSERSHPRLEAEHLAAGRLTLVQHGHRERLRASMAAGGFGGIPNEWWHFDLGDRDQVRHRYTRVE